MCQLLAFTKTLVKLKSSKTRPITTTPTLLQSLCTWGLWQYGMWSFQTGGTKLERFLHKNQHTQRILLNLRIGLMGRCQKLMLSKNVNNKKCNPKMKLFNKQKIENDEDNF